ncbi:DNA-binding protein [Spirulina sp. CCNP1310]|uniref:helix-turn-helix transcriptional regulator n=1 Tax=Spirulina sp. CCNP1310 TaxID=3110249 RepID=UPI002B20968A|nr:DNA-binding protein [Spirulina sp. CCNP1310]MEA5419887.1 DNA-binding protein [Spirulina sp. CCNP1310]
MKEYDFTLKFSIGNFPIDPDSYVEALYTGGCDDALIGVGKKGYLSLNFIREASSAYDAISTAIADVKNVIPSANLIEAAPDFVGLTDVAKIIGCTRQNIRKLIVESEPRSLLPIYEGTPSIWHLAEILAWLREFKTYSIDDSLMEIAKANMDINIAKSWQKVAPTAQEKIQRLAL